MRWFFSSGSKTLLIVSLALLALIALPACPGGDSGKTVQPPARDAQPGGAQSDIDLDAVVEKARKNVEKLRLTLGASRETRIEILEARPAEIPGMAVLNVRVNLQNRTALRRVPVTTDLRFVIAGTILPLGKIPRQRVVLENVNNEGKPTRGKPDAAITIVEYSDFQCPYCRVIQPEIERVLREYEGQTKLVYKHYPLEIHPWAWDASLLAECARKQKPELFWKLHDFYYAESEKLTRANLLPKTKEVLGADLTDEEAFTKCYLDQEPADIVRKDIDEGKSVGVKGTPVVLINDVFISGVFPYEVLKAIVQEELGEDWLEDEG